MKNIRKIAGVVTLALCAMTHLYGQDSRGRVVGQVIDSTSAAVPEATVIATNKATGVAVRSATNAAGAYSLPYLLPGIYTVTAERDGFKKFTRDNIQVRVNDSVELIIQMEIGNVSESINVTAETPLLQTAEATLGQVVDERRIMDLPLFAGNAMDLVHLAPGTVNGTDMRLRKAPFNNAPSQFSTTGGGNYNNDFTIDGVSNTYSDGTSPRVAYSPPAASITEFKVQTASYDATIGNTFGATVNVSTKGGTNELHGEFHEWFRNSALDTKNIFQNRSGQSLPVYQDNRFGNSLGGPVYIPKLYNGKNKTFWFYSWEANLFGNPQSYTTTVPTEKMRTGDLSEYLALGANYQVYDPFSTVTAPNGRFSRTPIPGNIIPQSRVTTVARNMMNLYPAANFPTTTALQYRNNYFNTNKALETYWSTIFRFDHAFSDTHRLFVRFHKDYWEEDKNRTFNNDVNGIILNRNNKGIALDDVYVINPSLLLNVRYGITYQDFPERRVSRGTDLVALGFSSQLAGLVPKELATIPRTAITPFQEFSAWESGDGVTASLIHNPVATITWMKGKHNVRFGTDMRIYRENRNRFQLAVSPQFTSNSTYTRGPLDTAAAPQLGGDVASFLMGIPSGSMSIVDSTAEQSSVYGFFIQDDYKLSRKLTVNVGMRYEYDTPITERFNRAATGFAGTQTNPISAQATANYALNPIPELPVSAFKVNGGLLFAGDGARDYWQGEKNNFMPRLGLAYQWDQKTVVRAGYGIFFNSIGILTSNTNATGFTQSTPIQASLDNGLTYIASYSNPFPNGLQQPLRAAGGLKTNLGQGLSFFPEKRLNPYAQRWSFGVQRELPMLFLLEATYVGNRGTRLNVNRDYNALPNSWLSTSPARDQERINFLAQAFPNPFRGTDPIYGANISRQQLLRPYPQFNDITGNDPIGYAWYHSLQMRVERRFNKGFTYQLSYTWSKSMEAVEFLNAGDLRPSEVVSGGDRTHRITSSGIWELPFGKGRAFANSLHPAADFAIGGWQLGGVWQHQSGSPLVFGNRIFNGDLNSIVLPENQRSVDQWFNVNAGFNRVAGQQLASNLRTFPLRFNGVRGPNQDRWDFSLIKNFTIKERFKTQFRAETFNAWNHPTLTNPNTDPTSGSFGVITGQDATRSWQLALRVTF